MAGHSSCMIFFSSAVENVEFVRDVYYLYPLTR